MYIYVGFLTGVITGGGVAGTAWMNPYVAFSLALGGSGLFVVVMKAWEKREGRITYPPEDGVEE